MVYGLLSVHRLAPRLRATSPGLFTTIRGTQLATCLNPLSGVLKPLSRVPIVGEEVSFMGDRIGQLASVISVVARSEDSVVR